MNLRLMMGVLCLLISLTKAHGQTNVTGTPKESRGRLVGQFVYDGKPPKPEDKSGLGKIQLNQPLTNTGNGRVSGVEIAYREYLQKGVRPKTADSSLLVSDKGGLANVVVFATSPNMPNKPETTPTITIQIKEGHFSPRVSGMRVDQTLIVENLDDVGFSFHFKAIRGDAVNYLIKAKSKQSIPFSTPEKLPLPFQSDVQAWATGLLFVHHNSYYAVTDAEGHFTMADLPPGKWEFRAWHERLGYLKNWPKGQFTREIQPGKNDLGTIKLSPSLFTK